MDREPVSGKYEDQIEGLQLTVQGEELVVAQKENVVLAKVTFSAGLKDLIEKAEQKSWDQINLEEFVKKYDGEILVESEFSVGLSAPYEYGADRDGNRGEMRQDYEEVEASDIEITKAEFRLVDEDGECLGGEDFCVEVEELDPLASYIEGKVNQDISSYVI